MDFLHLVLEHAGFCVEVPQRGQQKQTLPFSQRYPAQSGLPWDKVGEEHLWIQVGAAASAAQQAQGLLRGSGFVPSGC